MKTRILLSLIVASSCALLAMPALAEQPEPDREVNAVLALELDPGPDPEVDAEARDGQPEYQSAAEIFAVPLFGMATAALSPDAMGPAGSENESSPRAGGGPNCSLWPPSCPCPCIQDCYDQAEACMAQCTTPLCHFQCRQQDVICTDACCGIYC